MASTLPIHLPLGLPYLAASLPLPTELGGACPPEGLRPPAPHMLPKAQLDLRGFA